MKIKLMVLILFVSFNVAAKFECPKIKNVKDINLQKIAKELIVFGLSGASITPKSKCLTQSDFKYVVARPDPSNENPRPVNVVVKDDVKVELVGDIALLSIRSQLYGVKFKLEEGKKEHFDIINFVVYKDPKDGCAGLVFPPEKVYVKRKCLR
ncbi:MAG: hypothetical protein ISR65_09205 [Bacteriovoracaceae bacterium]|nr:hypothetical protein [Bacteriovoracaceae bacterium]